jgi:hypothetical protein
MATAGFLFIFVIFCGEEIFATRSHAALFQFDVSGGALGFAARPA